MRSEGAFSAFRAAAAWPMGEVAAEGIESWRRPVHRPPPLDNALVYATELDGTMPSTDGSCQSSLVNTPVSLRSVLGEEADLESPSMLSKIAEPKRRGKDIKKRKRRSYKELSGDVQMHCCHYPGCTKKYVGSYGRFNLQVHIKIKHLGGQNSNGQPKSPGTASTVTMGSSATPSPSSSPSPAPKRSPTRAHRGHKIGPPPEIVDCFEPEIKAEHGVSNEIKLPVPPIADAPLTGVLLPATWAYEDGSRGTMPHHCHTAERTDLHYANTELCEAHAYGESEHVCTCSRCLHSVAATDEHLADPAVTDAVVTDCLSSALFLDEPVQAQVSSVEQSYAPHSGMYSYGFESMTRDMSCWSNELSDVDMRILPLRTF